jgi:hypothetical protein
MQKSYIIVISFVMNNTTRAFWHSGAVSIDRGVRVSVRTRLAHIWEQYQTKTDKPTSIRQGEWATMKRNRVLVLFVFLLLLLSACRGQATPEPTASAQPESQSPTATPVLQATEVVLVEPTVQAVDYCLDCHTDKDMLIATAREEQEVINENSGEG